MATASLTAATRLFLRHVAQANAMHNVGAHPARTQAGFRYYSPEGQLLAPGRPSIVGPLDAYLAGLLSLPNLGLRRLAIFLHTQLARRPQMARELDTRLADAMRTWKQVAAAAGAPDGPLTPEHVQGFVDTFSPIFKYIRLEIPPTRAFISGALCWELGRIGGERFLPTDLPAELSALYAQRQDPSQSATAALDDCFKILLRSESLALPARAADLRAVASLALSAGDFHSAVALLAHSAQSECVSKAPLHCCPFLATHRPGLWVAGAPRLGYADPAPSPSGPSSRVLSHAASWQ